MTKTEVLTALLHITSVLHDLQTYDVSSTVAALVPPYIPEIGDWCVDQVGLTDT